MTTYFVSRHPGAIEWARRRGIEAITVDHFDVACVKLGDTVLGTLPIGLIAEVNLRGGKYLHLEIDLPSEARGKDLSADDMDQYDARLTEYEARRVDGHTSSQTKSKKI
jgi:CRISPR-associated protein Csx16